MCKIPVGNQFALVDPEDFDILSKYKWNIVSGRYAVSSKLGRMHRYLLCVTDPLQYVDHINGNGLDNRKENLRLCTNQQNQFNQRAIRGSSKYKGVTFEKSRNKWKAAVKVNGKSINLGRYDTELEAAQAYNEKVKQYYGEFAYLNAL